MKHTPSQLSFLERIPSFSLLLIMTVGMVIGAALIPMLRVAYEPTPQQEQTLSVSVSWPGASPRVMEQEITSKIEGMVSSVAGVESTTSTSTSGNGTINIQLKKKVNVAAVRFEISSLLRQAAQRFPEGAGHPILSDRQAGGQQQQRARQVLTYIIHADMPAENIQYYVERNIKPYLNQIDYVREINVSGASPLYLDIEYDPLKLKSYGIDATTISTGLQHFLGQRSIVGHVDHTDRKGHRERICLFLETPPLQAAIGLTPLTTVEGKIIYLNEVATLNYQPRSTDKFFRINGLNTLHLSILIDNKVNLIKASAALRKQMEKIQTQLNDDFSITLISDEAKEVREELQKLISRTFLSLLLLFVFVWLTSRSGRYLSVIALSLLANVLIAVLFFYLCNVELNIVSLAGVAVSFGIMIDTTIVMVDHYSYYRNRNVFLAILAALLTTVGSLVIVFWMPDEVQSTLSDFAAIIIINLIVALVVALFFVPALIDRLQLQQHQLKKSQRHYRRIARWSDFYSRYIRLTQKHKWIYIGLMIGAFGLPLHWLPERIGMNYSEYIAQGRPEFQWYEKLYNQTIGSEYYQQHLRPNLEKWLGGSLRLFTSYHSAPLFSNNERAPKLLITAKLTDGENNTNLLNQKIGQIENFLKQFPSIKRFVTQGNGKQAHITVEFTEDALYTEFPHQLEWQVIRETATIGGVEWLTSGVTMQGYSNALARHGKNYSIGLSGYNYDLLHKYAEELVAMLQANQQVKNPSIELPGLIDWGYSDEDKNKEMYIQYNPQQVALYDLDLTANYHALSALLNQQKIGTYQNQEQKIDIESHSALRDQFDVWHLLHSYIPVGNTPVSFAQIGKIGTRSVNKEITKKNQEYSLDVAFNFNGEREEVTDFIQQTTQTFNASLPMGFRTNNNSFGWHENNGHPYAWLLLIVVIIFFTCSILFESVRRPLVIITLIPLSFIGTFLTFYFTKVDFGTGGFASLVLLSGLVVNAGIYIINEYQEIYQTCEGRKSHLSSIQQYVKAFNHKIIAVLLTVLSTVLGLVPFLLDGPKAEPFWFSFAIGIMGGLLFSVVALTFFLPILLHLSPNRSA